MTGRIWMPVVFAWTCLAVAAGHTTAQAGTRYLYFIRHGDYDSERPTDDPAGNGLNALGREQTRLLGARLAALPWRPSTLVSSTLRRADETTAILGRRLRMPYVRDSLLSECLPATDRDDWRRGHAPEEIALCDSNLARAWRAYVTPAPDGDLHDVLVCHGNVIRWFVSRVVGGDPVRWSSMNIGNASVTVVAIQADGRVRLASFSDVGHIPASKQSWTGTGAGWGQEER